MKRIDLRDMLRIECVSMYYKNPMLILLGGNSIRFILFSVFALDLPEEREP